LVGWLVRSFVRLLGWFVRLVGLLVLLLVIGDWR